MYVINATKKISVAKTAKTPVQNKPKSIPPHFFRSSSLLLHKVMRERELIFIRFLRCLFPVNLFLPFFTIMAAWVSLFAFIADGFLAVTVSINHHLRASWHFKCARLVKLIPPPLML